MARGGARPGAGRPKKPRPPAGRVVIEKLAPAVVVPGADTPLGYMLDVMMDPLADFDRRDKMAMAAAPFMHARLAPSSPSKKEDQKEAATRASRGKFAAPAAPKLVVSNP